MEWAFAGPATLKQRLGHLDAKKIAAMDVEDFVAVCCEKPAIHRFPASMGRRIHDLCVLLTDRYGGKGANVWKGVESGDELYRRLRELPGYGEEKSKIFVAILGKRMSVEPTDWRDCGGRLRRRCATIGRRHRRARIAREGARVEEGAEGGEEGQARTNRDRLNRGLGHTVHPRHRRRPVADTIVLVPRPLRRRVRHLRLLRTQSGGHRTGAAQLAPADPQRPDLRWRAASRQPVGDGAVPAAAPDAPARHQPGDGGPRRRSRRVARCRHGVARSAARGEPDRRDGRSAHRHRRRLDAHQVGPVRTDPGDRLDSDAARGAPCSPELVASMAGGCCSLGDNRSDPAGRSPAARVPDGRVGDRGHRRVRLRRPALAPARSRRRGRCARRLYRAAATRCGVVRHCGQRDQGRPGPRPAPAPGAVAHPAGFCSDISRHGAGSGSGDLRGRVRGRRVHRRRRCAPGRRRPRPGRHRPAITPVGHCTGHGSRAVAHVGDRSSNGDLSPRVRDRSRIRPRPRRGALGGDRRDRRGAVRRCRHRRDPAGRAATTRCGGDDRHRRCGRPRCARRRRHVRSALRSHLGRSPRPWR